ncbi:hypothetical protein F4810DRAFT_620786 [Camillea tinctor]|nr:hypothetical protein F4810DRAFT_620786 [Camillea tinctor]
MQSLLSRVAHAQSSCHCRFCHHTLHTLHTTTSTLIRRTTTATSRRRKPSFADVFTACYTTILGTAAVVDSHVKETRHRKIDSQIEQTKAWLAARGSIPEKDVVVVADAPPDSGKSKGRYPLDRWRRKEKNALLRELSHLCGITLQPPNNPSWLQDQMTWVRIEANIAVEELDPEYLLREPKDKHQLQLTANTIVTLVDQLLIHCQIKQSFRSQDDFEGDDSRREVAEGAIAEIEKLYWSRHWPSYEHPLEQPEKAAKTRSMLSDSIRRNFNRAASTKEIVANICHNLLTSSIPPSIHTYNTLMAGFNRINRPDLAHVVIQSYIHNTTWPATQMTMVCLLNHYRCTDEINGLQDIIQRMRGARDDGLHFRVLPKVPWLRRDLEGYALRKYSYVLRAPRDDDVYDSIVAGWLQCGEVGNAAMAFVACLRNGCSIHYLTLQKLLRACLSTVDYAIARKLVRGMAKDFGKFAIMIHQIVRETSTGIARIIINHFWHILEICWLPYDFIDTPVKRTFARATEQLKVLLITTQVQLEVRETAELCIYSLKKLLNSPLEDRLDRVIHVLNAAQKPRKRYQHVMAGFQRLSRLIAVQTRHQELLVRAAPITVQAKAAIIKARTGWDMDPSSLLESTAPPKSDIQRYRLIALCNALEVIELPSGPMTRNDLRFLLLRHIPNDRLARKLENSTSVNNLSPRALLEFYRPRFCDAPDPDPDDEGYSEVISQLERDILEIEDNIKALLIPPISGEKQKLVLFRSSRWHKIPIGEVVKYHLRRGPELIGPKLIGGTPDRDGERGVPPAEAPRELSRELKELALKPYVAPIDTMTVWKPFEKRVPSAEAPRELSGELKELPGSLPKVLAALSLSILVTAATLYFR